MAELLKKERFAFLAIKPAWRKGIIKIKGLAALRLRYPLADITISLIAAMIKFFGE